VESVLIGIYSKFLEIYFLLICVQAAESGNVEEFSRLYIEQPSRIDVRDSKGRSATHQAAARNKVSILQFIFNHHQGNSSFKCLYQLFKTYLFLDLNLLDSGKNTPLHLAVENTALDAISFLLEQ
jgi:transient receptor potential cation channel subfamily A member 1